MLPRMCFSFGGNTVPYCSHYKSSVHLSDFPMALMFIMTHFCLLTEYAGGWRFIAQKELSEVMNESPNVVAHGYNPAEAGELLRGQGQSGLCCEFQITLGYSVKPYFQQRWG